MILNNFDNSSTGVNLELEIFYDTLQAQDDFIENFKVSQYANRGRGSLLIYTAFGNLPDSWKPEYQLQGDPTEIIKVFCNHAPYGARNFLTELFDLLDVTSSNNVTTDDLNFVLPDIADLMDVDGIGAMLDDIMPDRLWCKNFSEFTVRGFSQGDVANIIVPDVLRDVLGVPEGREILSYDLAQNLIYGCPFRAVLHTPGGPFNFGEVMPDAYVWDKDDAIEAFTKHYYGPDKDYILVWLENNLPLDLDVI